MDSRKIIFAGLLLVLSFILMKFNPIGLNFGINTIIGLALISVLGAVTAIAGMSGLPFYFALPILLFSFLDMRALGIMIFVVLGLFFSSAEAGNLILPKMGKIAKCAFKGYAVMALISVFAIFPTVNFSIPPVVSGLAVNLLVPAIGCNTDYTGRECIDQLVTDLIDTQCGDDPECIIRYGNGRNTIEASFFEELSAQFPGFSLDRKVGEILEESLNTQIQMLIGPYEWIFKLIMAFVIFSVAMFFSPVLSAVAGILGMLFLKLFMVAGLVKKEVVNVDKIKYSL